MRRLQHFLPDVGAIQAELFDESDALFHFLEQRGEIHRVQQLVQLGLVQHAWPVARHTRWDFTMLLLDLVRRTKDLPGIHVGSRVRLSPALTLSSARELLNSWALLLNLGHLHGTFATETELLYELKRSHNRAALIGELLKSVPEGAAYDWALRVFDDERSYQFYQLLAFYRLDRLAAGHESVDAWKTMLARYVAPRPEESQALTRARLLFRRIRRLAFLSLDSSLTPSPVVIRLAQLASTPDALERLLAAKPWPASEDELESLEEFLSREIYDGREVLVALADTQPELRRRLRADIVRNGLRYTVESAAKTGHHSQPQRPGSTRAVFRGVVGTPFLQALSQGGRFRFSRRRYEDSFARWATVLGAKASLQIVQNASGSQLVLQTNVYRRNRIDFACATTGALLLTERLRKKLTSGIPIPGFDQYMFGGASRGIIDAALHHFFPNAGYWEWGDAVGAHVAVTGRKSDVLPLLEAARDVPGLSRSRSHELSVLVERVRNVQAQLFAVAVSDLTGYQHDRVTQLAELDGVIVGVDPSRADLVMTIVEAKYTSGAERAARTQLRDTLRKLGVRRGVRRGSPTATAVGRRGHAWTHLRSRYAS